MFMATSNDTSNTPSGRGVLCSLRVGARTKPMQHGAKRDRAVGRDIVHGGCKVPATAGELG